MRSEFDVIIVGAGPGGSNTAAVALRNGLKICQIEKYKFPRKKPCAGGLTIKAFNALQLDLGHSLKNTSAKLEFNLWNRQNKCFSCKSPILRMVSRPELDNYLVSQNIKHKNFIFLDDEEVQKINYGNFFSIQTNRRIITSKQLVGADGAYSKVNEIFKISKPKARATALEANLYKNKAELKHDLRPCFDFGAITQGYGWVFPKDNHWSVGLYTFAKGINLQAALKEYIRAKGFVAGNHPIYIDAHTIPVGGFSLSAPGVPVYLVGDAGGYADAITGEGIYYALESGRIAGEILSKVHNGKISHKNYYRRLWKSVLPDTLITYYLAKIFYSNIERSFYIIKNPLVWRPLIEGYASGATVSRCLTTGVFYLVKSLINKSEYI